MYFSSHAKILDLQNAYGLAGLGELTTAQCLSISLASAAVEKVLKSTDTGAKK